MIFTLLLILHVFVCFVLMVTVLIQQGKGASMGAAFGTAGSQTIFGSSGAGNFLTKTTAVCAGIFFATSLLLAYRSSFNRSVIDLSEPDNGAPTAPANAPAAPATGTAPKAGMPAKAPAAPAAPSVPAQGAKPAAPATGSAPAPAQAPTAPRAPAPTPAAPAPAAH